jgi:hypothetical protein
VRLDRLVHLIRHNAKLQTVSGNSMATVQLSTGRHKMDRPKNKNSTFTVAKTTLKKTVNIFLLAFYSFGTFCLPLGDFSVLQDIPEMYRHCKATEDKDMTPLDFITDHLVNIDGLFDKHDKGDEQKPHTPIQFRHSQIQTTFLVNQFEFSVSKPMPSKNKLPVYSEVFYFSGYISKIFRPPIV